MAIPFRIRWSRIFEGVYYMPYDYFHSWGESWKIYSSQKQMLIIYIYILELYTGEVRLGDEDLKEGEGLGLHYCST